VDPKAAIASFIYRAIVTPRKLMSQVMDQRVHLRGLVKRFILAIVRKDTHTPALFVDIQTDVNRLTRKIKSATLNIIHGKPPFGKFLRGTKNYIRKLETCLSFSIIRPERSEGSHPIEIMRFFAEFILSHEIRLFASLRVTVSEGLRMTFLGR
jgi:hypothetical protein